MKKITVIDSGEKISNSVYLYSSLSEILVGTKSKVYESSMGGRTYLEIEVEDRYYPTLKAETEDRIADIITINYKSEYIRPKINPSGLNAREKELLISALISADLEDDKRYVIGRIHSMEVYSIDGIMNFRLKPLKDKWDEVISYIPSYFAGSELKEFMGYLLEEKGERKVYISKQKVYDNRFKRLLRSYLLGENDLQIVKEVILSCSNRIELSGEIPKDDEFYLKEYFAGRIIFS